MDCLSRTAATSDYLSVKPNVKSGWWFGEVMTSQVKAVAGSSPTDLKRTSHAEIRAHQWASFGNATKQHKTLTTQADMMATTRLNGEGPGQGHFLGGNREVARLRCWGIQGWDSSWVAHLSKLRVSSQKVPVMKRNYLNWTINPITVSLMMEKMKQQLPPTSSTCIMCEFREGLTWKSFSSDLGTVDHRMGLEKSCRGNVYSPASKWRHSLLLPLAR